MSSYLGILRLTAVVAALVVSAIGSSAAHASFGVTGLHNTGASAGPQDTNYTVSGAGASGPWIYDAAAVAAVNSVYANSWVGNTANSQWIGPTAGVLSPPDVTTLFTYTLSNLQVATSGLISGVWATDNSAQMFIVQGLTKTLVASKGEDGYKTLSAFAIALTAGTYDLVFEVQNTAGSNPNPSGMQVAFTATPEPSTLLIWGALATVGCVVTWKKRTS